MKAAVYYGPRDIRVEDIPVPDIEPDELLVKVTACGICGSDLHTYRLGIFEDLGKPYPDGKRVMGHEYTGVVARVGSAITDFKVGDEIAGTGPGAFAEYTTVKHPARVVRHVPRGLEMLEVATAEPLATSVHASRLVAPRDGEQIVVIGLGIIGLGCVQVIKAISNARVIAVDGIQRRLDMAREFGADEVVNFRECDVLERVFELSGGAVPAPRLGFRHGQIDAVIDAAGAVNSTQQGIEMLKDQGGRLVLVALSEHPGPIDRNHLVRKHVTLMGSWTCTEDDFDFGLQLMASHKIDRKPLVTHEVSLDDAPLGFEIQERGEAVKVMVCP
jgi:threonine dehydrogenase-like Zn-dependent dehydrogenase